MLKFLLWLVLCVLCWPVAILALVLWPLLWLMSLPFRLVGIAVEGLFSVPRGLVIEAWNTVLFDKFVRFKHLLIAGLAGHSDELLSRRLFREGARVLDIGCG